MKKGIVDIITLGCSKNLVDSEKLMRQFASNGFIARHDPQKLNGEIAIINTCGFIDDAKEESINTILSVIEAKKHRKVGKVFVMGCLSERYRKEMQKELPEVDRFYGKFDWNKILSDIGLSYNKSYINERCLSTPTHSAYIKISEGCNQRCSYCAIPIITGKHTSRTIEDIVNEVKTLAQKGVKEFNLIAQDLTYYGLDIYKSRQIARLTEQIAKISGVEWVRLHYAYPNNFPKDLLKVIRDYPNVCNYLDMALQHISDNMLKKMHRNITKAETYNLIREIRESNPDIKLRTTLLVGHPYEEEKDFKELMEFVSDIRFDRLGTFAYSHEEGTFAGENYPDNIPDNIKQQRVSEIMSLQEKISEELNQQAIGKIMKVIVDREEGDYYIGRSEYDSPEIDGEVLIPNDRKLRIGNFYNVEITNSQSFDLFGKIIL